MTNEAGGTRKGRPPLSFFRDVPPGYGATVTVPTMPVVMCGSHW